MEFFAHVVRVNEKALLILPRPSRLGSSIVDPDRAAAFGSEPSASFLAHLPHTAAFFVAWPACSLGRTKYQYASLPNPSPNRVLGLFLRPLARAIQLSKPLWL